VEEKLLRFARAGLAVAGMKGKTYLSVGGVSMGIAGSIVDHNFFESWLGMKVQPVDMTELRRRIDQKSMTKLSWKWRWRGRTKTSATARIRTRSNISAMQNRAVRC
jgi:L-fucose isomerase